MSSFVNVFGGGIVQPSFSFYSTIDLNNNIALAWSTDFGNNPLVVSSIMDIYPTANGYSVVMPNCTNISVGFSFSINNRTGFSFILMSNDGVTPIATIYSRTFNEFYLTDNTFANGSWTLIPSQGTSAVTSIGLNATGAAVGNITISSTTTNPITLGGIFSINLAGDLASITGLGGATGIAIRTAENTWATGAIAGTANQISVQNGNGVAANPTISLATAISGVNSIRLAGGNLSLGFAPNVIAATNVNGGVSIQSTGTGNVELLASNNGNIELNAPGGVIGSSSDIILGDRRGIVFGNSFDPENPKTIKIVSPNIVSNSYTINLPGGIPSATQCLGVVSVVDGSTVNADWLNVANITSTTTMDTIPYFTNTTGGSASSTIVATGDDGTSAHRRTGITISNTGTLQVGHIIALLNTISTASGSIILSPASPGLVTINSHAEIRAGNQLRLYNPADDFYYALTSGTGLAASYISYLPINNGTAGGVLSTDGLNPATLTWTNALTDLTGLSFGSGNVELTSTSIVGVTTLRLLNAGNISFAGAGSNIAISATSISNIGTASFGTNNISIAGTSLGTNTANTVTLKTNGNPAITIDASQNVSLSENLDISSNLEVGGNADIGGSFSTNPNVASSEVVLFALGTPYLNASGYDIMLIVYVGVSIGPTMLTFSVSPVSITSGQSFSATITQSYTIPLYVPNNYYAYVAATGGTASLTIAQAIPI